MDFASRFATFKQPSTRPVADARLLRATTHADLPGELFETHQSGLGWRTLAERLTGPPYGELEIFLHLAAGAATLPAVSRFVWAQTYATRPVRIVVGFPPAGATDIIARITAQWLSERLPQSVIVENKPGAGTNLAVQAVVNSPADGYTLLVAGTTNAVNATFYETLPFNFRRDIAPVAGLVRFPLVMIVNPSVPAKTVPEFVAYAKANPGKISMASYGTGTSGHLSGELFMAMTGIKMVHVPYRGEALALTDMIGGQVQMMFSTLPGSTEYIIIRPGPCVHLL
jgi:tripartite-type tricarboxylate transporter receptor subunit TctC